MDRRHFLAGMLASAGSLAPRETTAQTSCYALQANGRCYTQKMVSDAFACIQGVAGRYGIPGLSVSIAEKGTTIFTGVNGYADFNRQVPVQPYHKFRFASLSKPITSMAVMRELRNGLNLNDLISAYLSTRYGTSTYLLPPANFFKVKLYDLLTHTSGLQNLGCADRIFHDRGLSRIQFGNKLIRGLPFINEPGKVWDYSNDGFFLIGEYLAQRYQTTYEDFVKTRLFTPANAQLEMSQSGLGGSLVNEVSYHDDVPGDCSSTDFQPLALNVNRMSTHGGWVGTPTDMAKIVSQASTLLSASEITTMTTPTALNNSYGCGWYLSNGQWWHLGSLPGTAAALLRTPNGISYVSVANTRMMSANTNNYVLPGLSAQDMTAPGNLGLQSILDNLNQALRKALQLG